MNHKSDRLKIWPASPGKMDKPQKKFVEDFLRKRDFGRLLDLCDRDRRFWQEVRFRLYDIDERLRWPAIETAARFMQYRWQSGQRELPARERDVDLALCR